MRARVKVDVTFFRYFHSPPFLVVFFTFLSESIQVFSAIKTVTMPTVFTTMNAAILSFAKR
jgi:hypothetical protein